MAYKTETKNGIEMMVGIISNDPTTIRNMESNDTHVPVLYERKEDCCGCTACYAICPKEAIDMIEDEEGFLYPSIDAEKCIRCQMCIKICPIKAADAANAR